MTGTLIDGIIAYAVTTGRLGANVLERVIDGERSDHLGTIVFIHGNVSSSQFWQPTMLRMPEVYRCIAIDLRGFGDSETLDVDATRGLADFSDDVASVLSEMAIESAHFVGWSMGGAIILQLLDRSPVSSLVSRVVLDAPVIDWGDVLSHHARGHRLPPHIGSLARVMMRQRWGHRLLGVHESVDLARTDWVRRSAELHHQFLLIHSADDEFVPVGPSRELARARPDLVTLQEWSTARHCKEWNTDPVRWESLVADFAAG